MSVKKVKFPRSLPYCYDKKLPSRSNAPKGKRPLTSLSWPPVMRFPSSWINLQQVKVRSDRFAMGLDSFQGKTRTLPAWTLLNVPLHSKAARCVSLKSMEKIGNRSCKRTQST